MVHLIPVGGYTLMNLVTGRDLDTTGSQACPVVFCRPSTVPITVRRGAPGQSMRVLLAIPCCSSEPPPRRRRRTSAREQKRNKPSPTGPHETNQTHRYRAQNATARAQQHGSELWSPVRDEEAAGSNPVTPSVFPHQRSLPDLVSVAMRKSSQVAIKKSPLVAK